MSNLTKDLSLLHTSPQKNNNNKHINGEDETLVRQNLPTASISFSGLGLQGISQHQLDILEANGGTNYASTIQ